MSWNKLVETNFSILLNQFKMQDSDDFQNVAELISINDVMLDNEECSNEILRDIFEKQEDLYIGYEKGEFSLKYCLDN